MIFQAGRLLIIRLIATDCRRLADDAAADADKQAISPRAMPVPAAPLCLRCHLLPS